MSPQSLAQGRWVPSNGAPVRSVPLHSDSSFDNLSLLPEAMPIGMVSRNPSSENLHIHEVPKLTRLSSSEPLTVFQQRPQRTENMPVPNITHTHIHTHTHTNTNTHGRLRLAKHTGGHEFDITFTQEEWKALSFDERAVRVCLEKASARRLSVHTIGLEGAKLQEADLSTP